MRTPPKQHTYGSHETETRKRKPDDEVRTAPNDSPTLHAKPREAGDEFSVLLHLGLL